MHFATFGFLKYSEERHQKASPFRGVFLFTALSAPLSLTASYATVRGKKSLDEHATHREYKENTITYS